MTWITETFIPEAKKVIDVKDDLNVTQFLSLASEGTAVRWTSDYHNAKSFLIAVDKRITKNTKPLKPSSTLRDAFNHHRQSQSHRARIQARLLIPIDGGLNIKLPRAPDVRSALREALSDPPTDGFDISLRELLGIVGAHEWRKKGIEVKALSGAKIHPHYGVFFPVRSEYLDLLVQAPLPASVEVAFDIGVGSGVLSAILAQRNVKKIIATDSEPRALECARENFARLGLEKQINLEQRNLFPEGKADLIVCNPPWLPGRPTSRLEGAIYDFESQMLKGFLNGLKLHLNQNGEAWLIISNFAELLGLRGPNELQSWLTTAGLKTVGKLNTHPNHPKSKDKTDPLFEARTKETTTLWRVTS